MPFFRCRTRGCGRTRSFKETPPWGSTCTGCFEENTWDPYDGPVHPSLLDEEDKQYDILLGETQKLLQARENCAAAELQIAQELRNKNKHTKEELEALSQRLKLCKDVDADLRRQIKILDDKIDDLGNRKTIRKDSQEAYDTAADQDVLYIGNRMFVSNFARGSDANKILNVPNWSWGLNCAWVEGGVHAKARYEVKIEEGNAYTEIPFSIQQRLSSGEAIDYDGFLELCRDEGQGSLLWYNKDGADRPTWTALEMAVMLRAGYRFEFGETVYVVPPT